MEPGLEPIGVAKRPDVPPGGHERLLGGVLGGYPVPQDEPGGGIEPADPEARQLRERLVIPCHRPFHKVPRHRVSDRGTAHPAALTGYGECRARIVPGRLTFRGVHAWSRAHDGIARTAAVRRRWLRRWLPSDRWHPGGDRCHRESVVGRSPAPPDGARSTGWRSCAGEEVTAPPAPPRLPTEARVRDPTTLSPERVGPSHLWPLLALQRKVAAGDPHHRKRP